jgi:integrase
MISLTPSLALVLREHQEQQEALKATLGVELLEDDLVFCHYDGSPYLPDTITHVWLKLTRKLGLDGIRTLDVYSHVIPGLQEAAAIRFDEILGQAARLTLPASEEAA